jgi:hypothetical protein
MRGLARLRVLIVAVAAAATVIGLAPAASASYQMSPVGPGSNWVPNGGVHAVALSPDGGTVYVGGAFHVASTATGGVAALDAVTGARKWQIDTNGDVRALALNGDQLLMGGAFTAVSGTTHRKIASVSAATGTVTSTFKGVVGGTVRDIVVVNGIVYFGGAFSNHGAMAQVGLGAVTATTGANVTSFTAGVGYTAPGSTTRTNGTVYALGTDGTRLFVGGKFTDVGIGQPRSQLASFSLATNALDAWAPATACGSCNVIWDLTIRDNKVFTVGRNPGTLYTVDKGTAAVIYRAPGYFNGDSQAVSVGPDGHVYVGGHFVTVKISAVTYSRPLVAEFAEINGKLVLQPFTTRFVTSYPGVWALASGPNGLYVGGDFTAAGPQVNGRNVDPYFAIFPPA